MVLRPNILCLKRLPTQKGKHLHFYDDEEEKGKFSLWFLDEHFGILVKFYNVDDIYRRKRNFCFGSSCFDVE